MILARCLTCDAVEPPGNTNALLWAIQHSRETGHPDRYRPDRELICTLAMPMPLNVVGLALSALAKALERLGYTEIDLLTDGTERIVATVPKRGKS